MTPKSASWIAVLALLASCDGELVADPDGAVPPGTDAGTTPRRDGGGGGPEDSAVPPGVDGGTRRDAGPPPVVGPCGALEFTADVEVVGQATDRIAWPDARCEPRAVSMARVGGGYVRRYEYEVGGATRVATGTDVPTGGGGRHPGWGYPVSHGMPGGALAIDAPGEFGPAFVGTHHAIYEYRFTWPRTEAQIVLRWFIAAGRDHPVLAITYDLTRVPEGTIDADTRAPYGDIAWDGDEMVGRTVVSGVEWGDRYRFVTTSAPLTMNSTWDYSEDNLVPYCLEWAEVNDAEMGAVQTQTWPQHDGGGYWHYANWGRTSETQVRTDGQVGRMPITWNWTYQLNQYELCIEDPSCVDDTTSSHRLAWGANFGAVGSARYAAYGDDRELSGHPYQSYSVFMVLGSHSDGVVRAQVGEIETVQRTTLRAAIGTVPTRGPAGVGRDDLAPLEPAGWDHRYAVWVLDADGGAVDFEATVASGALHHPVFVVRGRGAGAPTVRVDGADLVDGEGFVASVDADRDETWITLLGELRGTTRVEVR